MLEHRERAITHARHVRLSRNGDHQEVRIPREFELPGELALVRQENGRLVIEPAPTTLLGWLDTREPIEEEFPLIEELAHTPVDL